MSWVLSNEWGVSQIKKQNKTKQKTPKNPDMQDDFQEGPAISMEINPKFEWA